MGVRGPKSASLKMTGGDNPQKISKKTRKTIRKVIKKGKVEAPEAPRAPASEKSILDDFEYVYRQWGGRTKLLKEIRDDPKIRKDFLKTLMALEVKKVEQGLKGDSKNGGTTKGKLFVLKGLYDEPTGTDSRKSLPNILDPHSQQNVKDEFQGIELMEVEDPDVVQEEVDGG